MDKIYTIVFASDDGYAQHLCVAMYGVVKHFSKNECLQIIVLDGGISDINKNNICNSCSIYNKNINFISVDASIFRPYITKGYNEFTYIRLLTHEIVPVDQVLYLDSDIVVTADLLPLCEIVLGENLVGACMTEHPLTQEELSGKFKHIGRSEPLFGAGILLMNLKKMRQGEYSRKFFDYLKKYKDSIVFCDQDVLNHFSNQQRLILDPIYNVTNTLLYNQFSEQTRYDKKSFEKIKRDAAIIHFAGGLRPWDGQCFHKGNNIYWQYLSETAYRGYSLSYKKRFSLQRIKFVVAYYISIFISMFGYSVYNKIISIWRKYFL